MPFSRHAPSTRRLSPANFVLECWRLSSRPDFALRVQLSFEWMEHETARQMIKFALNHLLSACQPQQQPKHQKCENRKKMEFSDNGTLVRPPTLVHCIWMARISKKWSSFCRLAGRGQRRKTTIIFRFVLISEAAKWSVAGRVVDAARKKGNGHEHFARCRNLGTPKFICTHNEWRRYKSLSINHRRSWVVANDTISREWTRRNGGVRMQEIEML